MKKILFIVILFLNFLSFYSKSAVVVKKNPPWWGTFNYPISNFVSKAAAGTKSG